MNISIIVAMDRKGIIGHAGNLPWRLSADFQYFKAVTMGKAIIMGRKTHESIGCILPGRLNIVLTNRPGFKASGCVVVHSMDEAKAIASQANDMADEVFVIGGASLYAEVLAEAEHIYLTEVDADVEGDVFFPEFDRSGWHELERRRHSADEHNDFGFSFVVLERQR